MAIRKRDLNTTFISLTAVILIPFALYLKNNRFYYVDDKVAEYIPKLLDIARIIKSGEYPFISTSLMNGSVYAAEFQNGIYNPFVLSSALLLDFFDNLALGACFLAIVFQLIAFGGFYLLASEMGIRRGWANIFALSIVLNSFFVYWYTSAWFNPVVGTAFLPYAIWSSLVLMRELSLKTSTIFLLSCFLVASSGWPSTLLVLFGFLVLLLIDIWLIQKDHKKAILNTLIYIGVALVCSIPLLPLLLSSEMFTRVSVTQNTSNFLVGNIKDLVTFSFPFFKDFMHTWEGYEKLSFNSFYAAWYALPLLTMVDYKKVIIWKNQVWILILLSFGFGVSIMGPEHIGSIRFPIRMLQYYHIFGLLLVLVLMEAHSLLLTKGRLYLSLLLFIFQAILVFQVDPESLDTILVYLATMMIFTVFLFHSLRRHGDLCKVEIYVLIASILVFISIYSDAHHGRGSDWNVPTVRSGYTSLNDSNEGYVLFNGGYLGSEEEHAEFRPATTGLIWGDKPINGYTPLGNRYFREKINISDHGNITTFAMKKKGKELFEIDSNTGLELLELMKVNKIISFKGEWGTNLVDAMTDNWVVEEKTHTFSFNHEAYEYPGHISWVDKGVEILSVKSLKHGSEEYQIRNDTPSERHIVFARLWWPGYRAYLNGEEIHLERYSGFLISVLIPKRSQGNFTLSFNPPGSSAAVVLSTIGFVIVMVTSIVFSSMNRRLRTVGLQTKRVL